MFFQILRRGRIVTTDDIIAKLTPDIAEVHITGGMPADWPWERYLDIVRSIHEKFPNADVKAYTAVEVDFFHKKFRLPIEEVLRQLKAAGLRTMPGGGAEGDKTTVRTKEDADHSLPYMVAAAALDGEVTPAQYAHERITRDDVQRLLRRVGLGNRLPHRPGELSGGEQQRVAVAIALANSPSLLLADEPTGSLDRDNTRMLLDLFNAVRNELGVTVILVTHDRSIASAVDRYIEIRDGKTSREAVRRSEGAPSLADAAVDAGAGSAPDGASAEETHSTTNRSGSIPWVSSTIWVASLRARAL